jgi:two-component system phosphate regulon response regulator PhoB
MSDAADHYVLVADDDDELLEIVTFTLKRAGFEVEGVSNGRQVLISVDKRKPDVIVLDVMMPELDGYHAAMELSERLGANCPKILIMTSRDTQREQGLAKMSGAAKALQKPFAMKILVNEVRELLGLPPEAGD